MKAIKAGIFNVTTGQRMAELETERDRLEDALRLEQAKKQYRLTPEIILKYLDSLDGDLSDPAARDRILDEYVSRVLMDDEKVTVILRYTDEARDLPIRETIAALDKKSSEMADLQDAVGSERAHGALVKAGILGEDGDPDFFA